MKNNQDIRWMQRLQNYEKAFLEFEKEIQESSQREFSLLEKKGLIQSFEMVQELSWKVLSDFLKTQGNNDIYGSRDAYQLAFNNGLIQSGEALMDSIKSRNLTAHTYDEEDADDIFNKIIDSYYDAFREIYLVMQKEKEKHDL